MQEPDRDMGPVARPVALEGLDRLLDAAPDAMLVSDPAGRIVAVNRHAAALFGYTVNELVGAPVELLVPLRNRGVHPGLRQQYVRAPSTRPMRPGAARRKDGSEFPAEISLAPLPGTDGQFVCASVRDVSDRRRVEAELTHLALHDELTGLANRVLLTDRANQAVVRCHRDGSSVAILFVGLDRFREVNDGQGHAAGDAVLITAAARLKSAVRASDTVARFAGDEFLVVCDVAQPAEVTTIASRITDAFGAPFVTEHGEVCVTASVGIATGTGDPDGLIRDANTALCRAKDGGRNRTEFFDLTMRADAAQRLETHTALHHAIARDELRLFYQPVVDTATGVIQGVEALLRWDHPHRGRIGPAEFVTVAEETGLIVPIGTWVLETALAQWHEWASQRPDVPLTISVNLSAAQVRQPNLFDTVAAALEACDTPPHALCLEITETVLMTDLAGPRRTLEALRELGVRVAIDDFGTGYSSLTYLKRLPVDTVKIDREFIAGLGVAPYDTAIVAAIIDLAHTLDLTVVAEGVETDAQQSLLRTLGCDALQGFLFSAARPGPDLFEPTPGPSSAVKGDERRASVVTLDLRRHVS